MAKFCALFSGSSGNCTFIESGGVSILIDAGASVKAIRQALELIGEDIKSVNAIFVTHEHSDHIRGLPVFSTRFDAPIFANGGTMQGILADSSRITPARLSELTTGCEVDLGGLRVTSFATSHDSNESVGYRIHTSDGYDFAVVTDLGYISMPVKDAISACHLVMLESNHDVGMLNNGRYPYFLKRRILSERGHLSNESCSAVLPSLVETGTRHIVLAHLSCDNNLPELAVETAACALTSAGMKRGVDCTIEVAPRFGPGRLYTF